MAVVGTKTAEHGARGTGGCGEGQGEEGAVKPPLN